MERIGIVLTSTQPPRASSRYEPAITISPIAIPRA